MQTRFVNINTDGRDQYNANSVMFTNAGDTAVIINNVYPLLPGASWANNLPHGCIDVTEYSFVFADTKGTRLLIVSYAQPIG